MGIERTAQKFTVAEYLAMEETAEYRSEYFEGEIFAMSGGTGNHSRIAVDTMNSLSRQLSNGSCEVFDSTLKIRIQNSMAYFYPDLSVVCGGAEFEDESELILKNPILIVEVLSKSTEAFDRGKKFHRYKQITSFREYVLISQDEPHVDISFKTDEGIWQLDSYEGLDAEMELRSLGVKVRLADIYGRVKF